MADKSTRGIDRAPSEMEVVFLVTWGLHLAEKTYIDHMVDESYGL